MKINEALTGNFFDNLTEKIKTIQPFKWCIELGEKLESSVSKMIQSVKDYIKKIIQSLTTRELAYPDDYKKNEQLNEGYRAGAGVFAESAAIPLDLSLDLLQIYSIIQIKGLNIVDKVKQNAGIDGLGDTFLNIANSIKNGDLVGAAAEGLKTTMKGAWKVGKNAFQAMFPWVGPVMKAISTFFLLNSLWKKVQPIIQKAKFKKSEASISGSTSGTTSGTTNSESNVENNQKVQNNNQKPAVQAQKPAVQVQNPTTLAKKPTPPPQQKGQLQGQGDE